METFKIIRTYLSRIVLEVVRFPIQIRVPQGVVLGGGIVIAEAPCYRDVVVLENLRFQNVFRPQLNEKPAISNSSGLRSVSKKLRFRDRLAWTEVQTVHMKLCFKFLQHSMGGD